MSNVLDRYFGGEPLTSFNRGEQQALAHGLMHHDAYRNVRDPRNFQLGQDVSDLWRLAGEGQYLGAGGEVCTPSDSTPPR